MKKVLILEDDEKSAARFQEMLEGDEVEVVVVRVASEARKRFESGYFDAIVLDGTAPSVPGTQPSLVGPILAREFRRLGYEGPIIATSKDPGARALTRKGANEVVQHHSYSCDKLDELPWLLREVLGLLPKTVD